MKVCLLTRYFNYRGTGITRMSTEILKGLIKRGFSVHTTETNGTSLYSYFFYTLLEIPMKLPRRGIDIYHAITSPVEGIWLPGGRSIVTYCDALPILYPKQFGSGMGYNRWKNLIGRKYALFSWKTASRVRMLTCTSEEIKEELVEHLGIPEKKIRVIRMGIREDLEPYKKRNKTFRIGTLGQLDKRKRIDLLIRAFKKSDIEGELVIAGVGMDGPILKAIASGDDRIKFLGLVPDSELVDFYNSLDVFVFPTWAEGYGLPMIEAMACKKPIVVLDDSTIPWEIKSKCIIVEELGYPLGNLGYLNNLCEHVDYEGNYKFAKEHSWDDYVDRCVELYKEVAGAD